MDAIWLKKKGRYHYAYKVHTVVDTKGGFIVWGYVTPANVPDTVALDNILEEIDLAAGTVVFVNKGHGSASNREYLESNQLIDGIMNKAVRNKPLTEEEKPSNCIVSKCRYEVERTFGNLNSIKDLSEPNF